MLEQFVYMTSVWPTAALLARPSALLALGPFAAMLAYLRAAAFLALALDSLHWLLISSSSPPKVSPSLLLLLSRTCDGRIISLCYEHQAPSHTEDSEDKVAAV